MKCSHPLVALLLAVVAVLPVFTDDAKKDDDGFVPMFDGKSLKGWVNVNGAPGTFFVKDHEIITTGKPTGYLRTEKQYENFIADFEWKHIPPKPGEVGNSGFFVWADPLPAVGTGYTRGIEVQVLVNLTYKDKKTGAITATSQGDLFSIWGATCVPDRPHPLGWAALPAVRKSLQGRKRMEPLPRRSQRRRHQAGSQRPCRFRCQQVQAAKGYLALESEGSECHFRNLKIKELPSTKPKPGEIAEVAQDFKVLYTGLDLAGWKADAGVKKHWHAQDTVLHYDGKGTAKDNLIAHRKRVRHCELQVDYRFPAKNGTNSQFVFHPGDKAWAVVEVVPDGAGAVHVDLEKMGRIGEIGMNEVQKPAGQWNRLHVLVQGTKLTVTINGKPAAELESRFLGPKGTIELQPQGEMDFANLFVREMK